MKYRKVLWVFVFVFFGMIFTLLFWKYSLLLSSLLMITEIIKSRIIPIKIEPLWFVISGFMGTSVESVIMTNGAWSYGRIDLINFPLWLFFLWGLAGCVGVSLYQELSK